MGGYLVLFVRLGDCWHYSPQFISWRDLEAEKSVAARHPLDARMFF